MARFYRDVRYVGVAVAVVAAVGAMGLARAANPDVLWHIVHDKCAVAVAPCLLVDERDHFALLKDMRGIAQVLTIPTEKITGVEDPALLKPETPNFFADAWEHRSTMLTRLPHPIARNAISLAVNAQTARSQNQLHIHIDCLTPAARDALTQLAPTVGDTWAPLSAKVEGHDFTARKVAGEALGDFNPFRAVAATLADPVAEMYRRNIVVVGADFADGPGFLILTDMAPPVPLGYGGGEDVQDHDCKIAQ